MSRITRSELCLFVEGDKEKLQREFSAIWKIAREAGIDSGNSKILTPATTTSDQREAWIFRGDFDQMHCFIINVGTRLGPNNVLALQLE